MTTAHRNSLIKIATWAGIIAGALIPVGAIIGFVWKNIEAPVYTTISANEARHIAIEQQLTIILKAHEDDDKNQREDMRSLVEIIAAPPGSPERAVRVREFKAKH